MKINMSLNSFLIEYCRANKLPNNDLLDLYINHVYRIFMVKIYKEDLINYVHSDFVQNQSFYLNDAEFLFKFEEICHLNEGLVIFIVCREDLDVGNELRYSVLDIFGTEEESIKFFRDIFTSQIECDKNIKLEENVQNDREAYSDLMSLYSEISEVYGLPFGSLNDGWD